MKVFLALAAALLFVGCSSKPEDQAASTTTTTTTASDAGAATSTSGTASSQPATPEKPPVDRKPKDGEEVAVMDTTMGKIVLMFFRDKAPGHVKNFIKLAKSGFYDGTKFHRVIPGFMIQGGDPNTKSGDPGTWGGGGPGYTIKAEFNDVHHTRGILSMARTAQPDTAGSQFFIVVADHGDLDGQYTAFGQVLSGMDAADKIVNVPVHGGGGPDNDMPNDPPAIKSVKIVKWPVK